MKTTKIISFFNQKEIWLQTIVWLLFFASINVNWTESWISKSFLPESVAPHIAMIIPAVFLLNVYWLIPKYLNKEKWLRYIWLSFSFLIGFEITRTFVFAIVLQDSNTFLETFKTELFGENSVIFGLLNVLVFHSVFYSFVYRFAKDWLKNQSLIESLRLEKKKLQLDSFQVATQSGMNASKFTDIKNKEPKAKIIKKTFTVKKRDITFILKVNNIIYFQAQGDFVLAFDAENRKHIINESLKTVKEQVCESSFFQINRGELINFNYIRKFKAYTKNRLEISLHNSESCLYTSNSRTPDFRLWIEQH